MAVFQSAGAAGVAVGRAGCIIKGGRRGGIFLLLVKQEYYTEHETKKHN